MSNRSTGTGNPYNGAFMTPPSPVTAIVSSLLEARTARAITTDDFAGEVALGADGLGLDSIAIAEVLLQCEEEFGIDALALLQEQPLTVRCLALHVEHATAK